MQSHSISDRVQCFLTSQGQRKPGEPWYVSRAGLQSSTQPYQLTAQVLVHQAGIQGEGTSVVCHAILNPVHCRIETISWSPRAFVYHHFLSDAECDHLIDIGSRRVSVAVCDLPPLLSAHSVQHTKLRTCTHVMNTLTHMSAHTGHGLGHVCKLCFSCT